MLTKEQATAIADEIFHHGHLARLEKMNQRGNRISPLYSCKELRALPAWMRLEIVLQSQRAVARNLFFLAITLAWVIFCAISFIYGVSSGQGNSYTGLIIIGWVFPIFVRFIFVRHVVKNISRELQTSIEN